jgi:hypothetical protein
MEVSGQHHTPVELPPGVKGGGVELAEPVAKENVCAAEAV